MEFEQKAEEKKMSMSKNIARLAVTAGLTAALSFGGVMAPVTMAFAEGATTTTNSIVINKNAQNGDVAYKAYQIFKADVVDGNDGSSKIVSNVEWAVNGSAQTKIIEAIQKVDANGSNSLKDSPSAQDVANWLEDNFGSYEDGTIVDKNDLFNTLAKIVQQEVNPTKPINFTGESFPANQPFSFSESGYYLFLTDSSSISKSDDTTKKPDTGTSPIFAVIGGSPVSVTEKTSIPTVNKAIYDDEDNKWTLSGSDILTSPNLGADSSIGQYVKYQLVGTVASNINTYGSYEYTFKDKLPETMTPKYNKVSEGNSALDVTVKINGEPVVNGCSVDYRDHVLTVRFDNLKDCKDAHGETIDVSADSRVTVEYEAMLDPDIICNKNDGTIKQEYENILGVPQENTVKLEYSNNPNGNGIGSTVEHPAYDYTYGIDVTKVGSDKPNDGLANVEFLLKEDGSNKYIKANGTTTDKAEEAILKTDANGKINVFGLDQGTYILTEKTAAPGYNNSHSGEGIKFTICRNTLPANKTEAVQPACNIVSAANLNLVRKEESTTGMVHLTVTDEKGSNLPLTGLNGVTFTWIAGGAVLCIGVAHLIRSRKQAEESEQE